MTQQTSQTTADADVIDQANPARTSSDAESLADELGEIGVKTVDGEYITAPVVDIDSVTDDTIRVWYRFPTGEYIPETFTIPFPWNVYESKLARLLDYYTVSPETFSQLEQNPDIEIKLEETTLPVHQVLKDEVVDSVPQPHATNNSRNGESTPPPETRIHGYPQDAIRDHAQSNESLPSPGTVSVEHITTWQAADPINLVDDARYTADESHDTGEETTQSEHLAYYTGVIIGVATTLYVLSLLF